MAWIQIRLNSTNEKAENISDFLEEIGSVSVTFMVAKIHRFLNHFQAKHVCGEIRM